MHHRCNKLGKNGPKGSSGHPWESFLDDPFGAKVQNTASHRAGRASPCGRDGLRRWILACVDEMNASTRTGRTYDASGRRRAAEQRRQHVASVAAELFPARGWVGTTIDGVAEAAGVSPELVQR